MEVAEAQNPKNQQSDEPTPEFIALRDAHLAKEREAYLSRENKVNQ